MIPQPMTDSRRRIVAVCFLASALLLRNVHAAAEERQQTRSPSCRRTCSIAFVILTTSAQQACRAWAIDETWGSHFRIYFITGMSAANRPGARFVHFPGNDTYRNLKSKMKWFWLTYYEELKGFDWIFKGDDDTFVRGWWLCQYLAGLNSSVPLYLGSNYGGRNQLALNSGGAGYVLSKSSLALLYTCLVENRELFEEIRGSEEDVMTLRCLESSSNVLQLNTQDDKKIRFSPFSFNKRNLPDWTRLVMPEPGSDRRCRLSDSFFTFHRASVRDICIFHERYTREDQRSSGEKIAGQCKQMLMTTVLFWFNNLALLASMDDFKSSSPITYLAEASHFPLI
eukprot:scaffold2115_cov363-Pavlova_lutheri.AAC.1